MNGLTTARARTLRAGTVVFLAGMLCCAVASGSAHAAPAPTTGAAQAERNVVITDLSCPSADRCMTVGNDASGTRTRAYARLWNGSAWTDTRPRQGGRGNASYLFAVACPSRRVCVAVGDYETSADPLGRPYAQIFRAGKWKVTPVPEPPNDSFSSLSAVGCASARMCVAVGNALAGEHNQTYSVIWNGRKWRIKRLDLPAATTYSRLASVSCSGPRACTASGQYQTHDSSKSRTLIETWSGRAWTRQRTPNPRSGPNGSVLDGVSCWARRGCMAVGHANKLANDGSLTLAARLAGQRWTRSETLDLAAPATSVLLDVECPSRRSCVAVGVSFSQAPTPTTSPLMQAFDGTSWRIDQTPVPAGAFATSPVAVSCAAPGACMAVGNYNPSDPYLRMASPPSIPVALSYDGTAWTLAAAP